MNLEVSSLDDMSNGNTIKLKASTGLEARSTPRPRYR